MPLLGWAHPGLQEVFLPPSDACKALGGPGFQMSHLGWEGLSFFSWTFLLMRGS